MQKLWITGLALICLFGWPQRVDALTVDELLLACEQDGRPCAQIPWIQAYLGGGFDLIASLDEKTEYLEQIYCLAPEELFKLDKIVKFFEQHSEERGGENAMLLFVEFLAEEGGCQ